MMTRMMTATTSKASVCDGITRFCGHVNFVFAHELLRLNFQDLPFVKCERHSSQFHEVGYSRSSCVAFNRAAYRILRLRVCI